MKKTVKLPATEHTNIEIGEDGVLYIRIADFQGGSERASNTAAQIKEKFEDMLPDIKIIVGFQDLRFSTITKKQEFIGRLDGQIKKGK